MHNKQLLALGQQLVDEFFPCSMEIGKVCQHPDGRTVKIISGCFRDPTYGRISDWWEWQEVLPDGSFGPVEKGYGW